MWFLIRLVTMALLSYSYSTITDLSPLMKILVNLPVWSEKIWPNTSTGLIHTRFYRAGLSVWRIPYVIIVWCMVCGGGVGGCGVWVLFDRTCWHTSLRWPFAVYMDLGRCLRTSLDVRPSQVVKKPVYMALHQVSIKGIKQSW